MQSEFLRDPRLRILAATGLAFSFSALQGGFALAGMLVLTAGLVALADLTLRHWGRALRLPGLVVAGLVLVLPLTTSGAIWVQIGPLSLTQEGLEAAITIALRFLCIFTIITLFLTTLPVAHLLYGLRGLGVPAILVDMALLAWRHIGDLQQDLARMRLANRLRGGGRGPWLRRADLGAKGWILASLFLRSHGRSERIYHAMILRGHGAPDTALPDRTRPARADIHRMTALFAIALALVALDRLT